MKYLALFSLACALHAETIELSWSIVNTEHVAGYYIDYGCKESPVSFCENVLGGDITKRKLDLSPSRTYYFIVTPYDADKNKGTPSNTKYYSTYSVSTNVIMDKPKLFIKPIK